MHKATAFYLLLIVSSLLANPQSPIICSGEVSSELLSSEILEIRASDRSIIEWKDFSIDLGETTRFIQPSANSSVLNRVIEANPSHLLGQLESNGRVLLINPNGILVGKDARIDTNSLIASALDLNTELFLKDGLLSFAGNSEAPVINEGTIMTRSDALLIGHSVENHGRLEASQIAGVIASDNILLKPEGTQRIFVRTRQNMNGDENPFGLAFIPAKARVEGEISSIGGSIYVLGDVVEIGNGARIDASAPHGGGQIFIGGGYQGKNPDLLNAKITYVASDALLKADALETGDGGRIIIWGDDATGFYGEVHAKGGMLGGDGGFVEVSGAELDFQGFVSTFAALGKTGTLLLDPVSVTISAAANSNIAAGNLPPPPPAVANPYTVPFTASPANINSAALGAALGVNDVIIDSSGGDITVNFVVTWPGGNHSLSLINASTITLNQALNSSAGGGNITLIASGLITLSGNLAATVSTGAGNLSATSTGDSISVVKVIIASSGNVNLRANTNIDFIPALSAILIGGTGGITLSAGQDINVNGAGGNTLTTTSGQVSLQTDNGNINIPKGIRATTSGNIILNATRGSINLSNAVSSGTGNITGIAGTDINITLPLGQLITGGSRIDLTAGNNILVSGILNTIQNAAIINLTSARGSININEVIQTGAGTITARANTLDVNINLPSGRLSAGSGVAVTAQRNILVNGNAISIQSGFGNVDLQATTGNITINQVVRSTLGGHVFTTSGNNTTLSTAIATPLVTAAGEILMIAGNSMFLQGTSNITSTGAMVTLVVDNKSPLMPAIGNGIFVMEAGTQVKSGSPLRIFTALQQNGALNNQIAVGALLNGVSPYGPPYNYPGTMFIDTPYEVWCTYFAFPSPYPFPNLGVPFTIFYKNCMQLAAQQAQIIVTEFSLDLHPFDENLGWVEHFWVQYSPGISLDALSSEGFFLRRRHLNVINQPKSWTMLLPE